ncbi:siderophore-interacting protein [Hamadaea tsunoensis]|uniref:siderophore-interacting protein n=1 Tax=Hamadaea tsunoensis TaxID=53368 RepID=UPI0004105A4B|nr:siderophore-interacting protein [Hamadaea tsunoensis]
MIDTAGASTPDRGTPAGPQGGRGRRRQPPQPVQVVAVERLTHRLVSVRLGGAAPGTFADLPPTAHVKLFLPADGQAAPVLPQAGPDGLVWPAEAERPVVRTYTPRRFDPASGDLEIQFVLHGPGPAAAWAARAAVGDRLAVSGPGGRFQLDPAARRWWIAADESAIPAVATLLEALPAGADAEVHVEVDGPGDEFPLPRPERTTVVWHHRRTPEAWGAELEQAAREADLSEGTHAWVACEAGAMRRIRGLFLGERGLPRASLTSRGYWRLGTANHPDHDYGDDD